MEPQTKDKRMSGVLQAAAGKGRALPDQTAKEQIMDQPGCGFWIMAPAFGLALAIAVAIGIALRVRAELVSRVGSLESDLKAVSKLQDKAGRNGISSAAPTILKSGSE